MKIKTLFQSKKATNLSGNITTNGAVTIINKGSATVDGQIIQPASIVTNTINANELTTNNIQNNGNISTNSLSSNTISANTISSSSLSTGDLVANNIFSTGNLALEGDLTVEGDANFSTIKSTNIENTDTITTKNLNITGSAHFFELIIDQIKAAGGSILATPADGFTIDDITFNGMFYTNYEGTTYHFENCPFLWFKSTDGDNLRNDKGRKNTWDIWDQAICANFNAAFDGDYAVGVNNNLWWCMVGNTNNTNMSYSYADFMTYNSYSYAYTWNPTIGSYTYQWVNAEPKSTIGQPVLHDIYDRTQDNGELLETAYCHYIALLPYNPDNDSRPTQEENYSSWRWDGDTQYYYKQIGNDVAMLGHNWRDRRTNSDATNRRSAIYLSCYSNDLDQDLKPPFWAHYANIDDFTLDGRRLTKFDAAGGDVIGNFKVQAGNTQVDLDNYIDSRLITNPAGLKVMANYNDNIDLVVLQTDQSNKIHDLNNFPASIKIVATNNTTPIVVQSQYRNLHIQFLGTDYDLLNFQDDGQKQGIYLSSVQSIQTTGRYFNLSFDWRGTEETITNSSIYIYGTVEIDNTDYNISKSIPITYVDTVEGTDAELYRLVKKYESAVVDKNGDLTVDLQYKIQHIEGTTVTYPQPTNTQKLRIRVYGGTGSYTEFELSSSHWKSGGYWEWEESQENWYGQQLANRAMYAIVDLMDGTKILDSVLVNVELSNTSLFEVKNGLTQSIQANTTAINNETNARQTQYSSIMQTVNGITTTVANLQSYTYTYISEIKQDATEISLRVQTLDEGLRSTGIDITQGKINLQADKVTFTKSDGTVNDKISIDATTGTLNAENVNISGIIKANINYSPFIVLTENDATLSTSDNLYILDLENYITGNNVPIASNYALYNTNESYQLRAVLPQQLTERNGMELTFVGIPQTRMSSGYVQINGRMMYDDGVNPEFAGGQITIWPVRKSMIKMINASFGVEAAWWITKGAFYIDNPATTANPRRITI